MKIAFYKGQGDWIDKLIRLWTGQKYTHCELVFSNGLAFSASPREMGTRFKWIEFKKENWDFVDLKNFPKKPTLREAAKFKNLKYDFFGIFFTHVIGLARHKKNKWFCSEICGHLLGFERSFELTPGDLYNKIKKKG